MPDESDPPRKVYGFKEREFKRDNARAGESPAPLTAKELALLSSQTAGKIAPPTPPAARARADDPNDVFATLQGNRAAEIRAEADAVEIQKVKSRRRRDYWTALVAGNLVIFGTLMFGALNPVSVMFALGGSIVFSLGLTWAMWQVMGKY